MADIPESLKLNDGGRIPILGFGTWLMQGEEAYRAVRSALEVGYRHLDTATVYENQAEVGRALAESGVPREEVFLTTKIPPEHRRPPRETIEASLQMLRTDHVDLWLIHWPPDRGNAVALWEEMATLREEGKARSIGVSNFGAGGIDELVQATDVRPAVDQVRWSPFLHDPGFVEALDARDVVLEGYSPFKASRLGDPVITRVATAHGLTPAQVVIVWHLQHGIVAIPKSAQRERIEENFDVFGVDLDPEEMAALDGLGGGRPA